MSLFLALGTQWRWLAAASIAGAVMLRTGIDYGVIPACAASIGVELTGQVMVDIRMMENAALEVFSKEARR